MANPVDPRTGRPLTAKALRAVAGSHRRGLRLTRLFLAGDGRCHYCRADLDLRPVKGREGRAATVDHVVPRAAGGRDAAANRVICCLACNQAKKALPADEFRGANPSV